MVVTMLPGISASSLDDILHEAIERILTSGLPTAPSKGKALELQAVTLELTNPRARLSRSEDRSKLFSALGELCWYLHGSADVDDIAYYISYYRNLAEDGTLPGAYGPRLFSFDGCDQVRNVTTLLQSNQYSRRAVIQLFDHRDLLRHHKDVPCTCTLQFMIRSGSLHLVTYMRSNDVYLGLPHDIFSFTMLQEILSRTLEVDLGTYTHMVGSLHLYESHKISAQAFIQEGWQSRIEMPVMPVGDPWRPVDQLLQTEQALRSGTDPHTVPIPADTYWADLTRLLAIYSLFKAGRLDEIPSIQASLFSPVYDMFITDKYDPIS